MSNKKQSSVEWLNNEFASLYFDYFTGLIGNKEFNERHKVIFEKAKEIHKEESIGFAFSWSHERADRIDIENDYNETFK